MSDQEPASDSDYDDIEFDSGSEICYTDGEYSFARDEGEIPDYGYQLADNPSNLREKQFTKDVEHLIEAGQVFISQASSSNMDLTIVYNISHIPEDYLGILGLDPEKCITIYLDFKRGYLSSSGFPEITILEAGSIQWQLCNCLKHFIQHQSHDFINKFQAKTYHSSESFLKHMVDHVIERINNPGYYCVNCDKKLQYQGLKPVSCGNALCYYQYTELGLSCYQYKGKGITSNLLDEFKFYPAICKILCYFAYSCLTSHRVDKIFGEMPEHILNECRGQHTMAYQKMKTILETMPKIDDLAQIETEDELKIILKAIDPDAYYFIRWIFLTCRAHLEVIDSNDQNFLDEVKIPVSKSSHDSNPYHYTHSYGYKIKAAFKYISNPPEREMAFNKISQKNGVQKHFGFHGSPIENWHSIVRKSLINYSGTANQLNGAVYGSGIYLAPDFQTSYGYARNGSKWAPGDLDNIKCMVYCEILNDGTSGFKDAKPYYVISNEDLVRTKYLIIM